MDHNAPRTFSLCLQPGQVDRLDDLVARHRKRSEFVSRSALVRRALNLGLEILYGEEPDRDDPADVGAACGCDHRQVSTAQ